MTVREFCIKYEVPARIAAAAISMPVTTTPSFEGQRISSYGGYISGKVSLGFSDGAFGGGLSSARMIESLERAEPRVLDKLKIAAAEKGCNAVVGLNVSYITLDREYRSVSGRAANDATFIINASGTAVNIEPL